MDRQVKVADCSTVTPRESLNDYHFWHSAVVVRPNDDEDDHWFSLHSPRDKTEADSRHPIATFSVAASDFYRFVRLRQTAPNASVNQNLILC
jgi:alkylated DNA repair dioxygenase AlkB